MPKFIATSKDRYRATASERRIHGGSTVTDFFVQMEGDPEKRILVVRGYGPTPGERKTYAIREAERQFQAMERKANPSPLWRLNFQRSTPLTRARKELKDHRSVDVKATTSDKSERVKSYVFYDKPYAAWIIVANSQEKANEKVVHGLDAHDAAWVHGLPRASFDRLVDALRFTEDIRYIVVHNFNRCHKIDNRKNTRQEVPCWDQR